MDTLQNTVRTIQIVRLESATESPTVVVNAIRTPIAVAGINVITVHVCNTAAQTRERLATIPIMVRLL